MLGFMSIARLLILKDRFLNLTTIKLHASADPGLEERYFHFKFVSYFESKVNELDFWLSILMTSSIVGPDIQTITCDK